MFDYELDEVVKILPEMDAKSFDSLLEDMKIHGQLEPVWIYADKIIDGRHRQKACKILNIELKTQEWNGEGSLEEFVLGLNVNRRHLTVGQKALAAYKKSIKLGEEAKQRQRASGGDRRSSGYKESVVHGLEQPKRLPPAIELAARALGVSKQCVADIRQIAMEAPEMIKEIEAGASLRDVKNKITRGKHSLLIAKPDFQALEFKNFAIDHLEVLGANRIENLKGLVLLQKWLAGRVRNLGK